MQVQNIFFKVYISFCYRVRSFLLGCSKQLNEQCLLQFKIKLKLENEIKSFTIVLFPFQKKPVQKLIKLKLGIEIKSCTILLFPSK